MDLLSIIHLLNGLLMFVIPILLGMYLTTKFRSGWKIWLIGAATFILSQVFHIPFNLLLLNPALTKIRPAIPGEPGFLLVALLLGLSAGIFETAARYAMVRWWLRDNRSWRTGVLAGAGHGGIEAILLGILVLLAYFNMMAYRNFDLGSLDLTPEQLALALQQVQSYWNTPWYDTLLGTVERIFTIPFHIAASVIVMQVFTRQPGRQQPAWLVLAVLMHTLLDASAVYFAGQGSVYVAEAALGTMAVVGILVIFALRQPESQPAPAPLPGRPAAPPNFKPAPVEETTENLDNTRFQ